ncbi:MAG: hypothetical protein ACMUIP_00530 [bacterium]
MELLIIIINREEYFEKILSILVELGTSGATILESQEMGQFLAYEIPLFAGLRQLMGERKTANKTIMTLIEEEKTFADLKRILAEEKIDFTDPSTGVIFTLPVNNVIKAKTEDQ